MAGWRVDQDTNSLHLTLELIDVLLVAGGGVEAAGVTMTAKLHEGPGLGKGVLPVLGLVQTCVSTNVTLI